MNQEKKKKQCQKILFKFKELDKEFVITKVVQINVDKKMFVLEEYKEGEYRLTYSSSMVGTDLTKLTNIEIIREDT